MTASPVYRTPVFCPGCGQGMMTNGYTMYCDGPDCVLYSLTPEASEVDTGFPLTVLTPDEAELIYREGVAAFHEGKQFHEGPYAKSGTDVPDDEYQRGYEWRRGWNDAALGRAQ
jgi:hypothetical protein